MRNLEAALKETNSASANATLRPLLKTNQHGWIENDVVSKFIHNLSVKYLGYATASDMYDDGAYDYSSDDDDGSSSYDDGYDLESVRENFGDLMTEAVQDDNLQDVPGFDAVYELARDLSGFTGTPTEFEAVLKKSTEFSVAAVEQTTRYEG